MKKKFAAILSLVLFTYFISPVYADETGDMFAVLNADNEEIFNVNEYGYVFSKKGLLANGASSVGAAPMVLGQNAGNRGLVITDKAPTNPKRIYFGWNPGATFDYVELFALQEGVAYKNIVLAPSGGNVGIGTTNPEYLIDTGGAYCDGNTWVNASSREYKKHIKELTRDDAMKAFEALIPVSFSYKKNPEDQYLGFIAEDVPDLVATKDRKGLNSMDIVAVLTRVVQEQQKAANLQKKTIAELSNKVAELEERVGSRKVALNIE